MFRLLKTRYFFCVVFAVSIYSITSAQELTLPVYRLTIEQEFLDSLDADVYSDQTYPAQVEYEDEIYDCRVRYRGSANRRWQKRSWKIYFDHEGPEERSATNLNAEYIDNSLSRNYLAMQLSRFAGIPAPESRHISLFINNIYRGVYHEIEPVDEDFFARRNIRGCALFKAANHGARFAPPLHIEDLTYYYEPNIITTGSVDRLGARLTFLQYASPEMIADELDEILDLDNFLTFFAIQFCIGNYDGFSKNFYLYERADGRYILIPWDGDSSLGNNWWGQWVDGADVRHFGCQDHQAVLQRLISQSDWREELLEKIQLLLSDGFDNLAGAVDEIFDQIRHDVHLDEEKRQSNEDFDQEQQRILEYLSDRSEYLNDFNLCQRIEISECFVSHDYISSNEDTIRFEARINNLPHSVGVHIFDANLAETTAWLSLNISLNDSAAAGMIYNAELSLTGFTPPFYYCYFVKPNAIELSPTPPGGWRHIAYYRMSQPVILLDDTPPQPNEVTIGPFCQNSETASYYFGLINESERALNLSGCVIRIGQDYRLLRIREIETLEPGDTLFVTNHMVWATSILPERAVTGALFFVPVVRDTVFLETSSGRPLTSTVVGVINEIEDEVRGVVINEINYNSSDDFDPSDWIELHAWDDSYDLSGWSIRDSRDDHLYQFPERTALNENEYLVIVRDVEVFTDLFPDVEPLIGGFEFGFGGGGDEVRLFDGSGCLIDWVAYDDEDPWPHEPDGEGNTLELINPELPNYGPQNWRASTEPHVHGTPGATNSTYNSIRYITFPSTTEILMACPNPFNGRLQIEFMLDKSSELKLKVYDLSGREVAVIKSGNYDRGSYRLHWMAEGLPSGVYLVRLETGDVIRTLKVILMR